MWRERMSRALAASLEHERARIRLEAELRRAQHEPHAAFDAQLERDVVDWVRASLDPRAAPRPDRRTARRPAGCAAEQRRPDPTQLLLLEHRHAPARPRALLGKLGLERATPDHELAPARCQIELVRSEHAVARADQTTVEPRVPQCRDAVETEH